MPEMQTDPVISEMRGKVYDFLRDYLCPAIAEENIFYGNQNNISLPEDNEYCIYHIQDHTRRGTTIERYDADAESLKLTETSQASIRVDVYSGILDRARERALNLELVWRSSAACAYFKGSGMMPLYADSAQDTTFADTSENYLFRYTVTLIAGLTYGLNLGVAGFTGIPKIRLGTKINRSQDEEPTDPPQGAEDTFTIVNADVTTKITGSI